MEHSGAIPELLHAIDASLSATHPASRSLCRALASSWSGLSKKAEGPAGAEDSAFWAQVALDYAWERLHSGHWENVELGWRQAYSLAALLKALHLHLAQGPPGGGGRSEEALAELDKGLLMGAPILNHALHELATALKAEREAPPPGRGKKIGRVKFRNYTPISSSSAPGESTSSNTKPQTSLAVSAKDVPLIDMARRVSVEYCPPLVEFRQRHMLPSVPVVITGAMDHWPAYAEKKWRQVLFVY